MSRLLKTGAAVVLLAVVAVLAVTQIHRRTPKPVDPPPLPIHGPATGDGDKPETLDVYFSPLPSTEVIRYVGLGLAYHMAIVYTDRTGTSFGATSGPSDLKTPQTPGAAAEALVVAQVDEPTNFGVLVTDPGNDKPFVIGTDGDHYTRTKEGQTYPHKMVMQGRDLSAQWTRVLQTYALVAAQKLPYSPTNQNSNSLAGTALRRIGVENIVPNKDIFAPGVSADLPLTPRS